MSPCARYLQRCAQDLSYALWRADVHRLPAGELANSWRAINRQLLAQCPAGQTRCPQLQRLFDQAQAKYACLLQQRQLAEGAG